MDPRLNDTRAGRAVWLLAAFTAWATACSGQAPAGDRAGREGPSSPEDPWALYQGPETPARPTEDCRVTRIVDGDTLHCEPVGRIRLLGIDTPERGQEPFASEATRALEALLPVGSRVRLEPDARDRDDYDRALRYVWTDRGMINWVMVRSGHAVTLTYPPNVQHVEALTRAQREAREASSGLWAVDGFRCLPVAFRRGACPP